MAQRRKAPLQLRRPLKRAVRRPQWGELSCSWSRRARARPPAPPDASEAAAQGPAAAAEAIPGQPAAPVRRRRRRHPPAPWAAGAARVQPAGPVGASRSAPHLYAPARRPRRGRPRPQCRCTPRPSSSAWSPRLSPRARSRACARRAARRLARRPARRRRGKCWPPLRCPPPSRFLLRGGRRTRRQGAESLGMAKAQLAAWPALDRGLLSRLL
mmetsp:Transcript_44512/g.134939  ORF Transcript_44512/g.134939 Transcript_44512/m.134939 type:complete len:213 (+) Transcript_44512:255-893(+)